MFSRDLEAEARRLLSDLRARGLLVATAESCTGGLIAALLTEIPGSSEVVDRGFITYSNDAKVKMLGVRSELIADFGVVSREVAMAMAEGALRQSQAAIAVAVTGVAGPGGGSPAKPVGLVHVAAAGIGGHAKHRECRFGALGRTEIRLLAVRAALRLIVDMADVPAGTLGPQ